MAVVTDSSETFTACTPKVEFCCTSVNANNPIEDKWFAGIDHDSGTWVGGVLDGHGGALASQFVNERLQGMLLKAISSLSDREEIAKAIVRCFNDADKLLTRYIREQHKVFQPRLGVTSPVFAGSCACVAIVKDGLIYVANTGDSRAVLATRADTGAYHAHPLSKDHKCTDPDEVALVKARSADPNPIQKTKTGYHRVACSLAVTRAFGDNYLKVPDLAPPTYRPGVPYITCEPEVRIHEWNPDEDLCLVIASDGLWDHLTNKQVIDTIVPPLTSVPSPSSRSSRRLAARSKPSVSHVTLQRLLQQVASKSAITVSNLLGMRAKQRRKKFDDTTILTLKLSARNSYPVPGRPLPVITEVRPTTPTAECATPIYVPSSSPVSIVTPETPAVDANPPNPEEKHDWSALVHSPPRLKRCSTVALVERVVVHPPRSATIRPSEMSLSQPTLGSGRHAAEEKCQSPPSLRSNRVWKAAGAKLLRSSHSIARVARSGVTTRGSLGSRADATNRRAKRAAPGESPPRRARKRRRLRQAATP